MNDPALPFTGERFTPECVREIWYEHWHRYAFARPLAAGRKVLDAACGEGYGSALLAGVAASVTGLDIDPASIAHASARYANVPNLRYECGDAAALPFTAHAFDLVVSFETLEHLDAQEELVAGFARVLADDGVLVISSPDKHVYSELAGFRNEFHVRELYRQEFIDLLAAHFSHVRLYGQKLLFQSAIWPLDAAGGAPQAATAREGGARLEEGFGYAPMYFVAVCAKRELPGALPGLSLFGDGEESVYAHYNHEIRKNMAAGQRIAELEAELARLRAAGEPEAARRWWRRKPSR
ncbi:MAG: class I SAM-dependent methyltransferase [Xanthomonadales bacterium]|nr:class I SAM-dependent methyltransferase [Xanthomonadales bacterium]